MAIWSLNERQGQSTLVLILALLVGVADLARSISPEEENLGDAFTRVDLGGQGGGVADFQRNPATPLRLERGDIHDNAAAGVGRFADADGDHVPRDFKVL